MVKVLRLNVFFTFVQNVENPSENVFAGFNTPHDILDCTEASGKHEARDGLASEHEWRKRAIDKEKT